VGDLARAQKTALEKMKGMESELTILRAEEKALKMDYQTEAMKALSKQGQTWQGTYSSKRFGRLSARKSLNISMRFSARLR